jgi:hypothetical protein
VEGSGWVQEGAGIRRLGLVIADGDVPPDRQVGGVEIEISPMTGDPLFTRSTFSMYLDKSQSAMADHDFLHVSAIAGS